MNHLHLDAAYSDGMDLDVLHNQRWQGIEWPPVTPCLAPIEAQFVQLFHRWGCREWASRGGIVQ